MMTDMLLINQLNKDKMFEVGQEVVCVKKGRWRRKDTGESEAHGPTYLEECVIVRVSNVGLVLEDYENIPGVDGTPAYRSKYFIPKSEITEIEVLSEVKSVMLPNVEELALIGQ